MRATSAHGIISPERLIVTPRARLVVVEHVLGSAVEQLQFNRERLWNDLRVAMPPAVGASRFDHRADVTAIGLVALSLVLGRPILKAEYPHRIGQLLNDARARTTGADDQPLPDALHNWIARALQLDPRQGFTSATDAQVALEDALADDSGFVAAPVALETFLSRYIAAMLDPVVPVPAPPAPVAFVPPVTAPPAPVVTPAAVAPPAPVAPPAAAPVPVAVPAPVAVAPVPVPPPIAAAVPAAPRVPAPAPAPVPPAPIAKAPEPPAVAIVQSRPRSSRQRSRGREPPAAASRATTPFDRDFEDLAGGIRRARSGAVEGLRHFRRRRRGGAQRAGASTPRVRSRAGVAWRCCRCSPSD